MSTRETSFAILLSWMRETHHFDSSLFQLSSLCFGGPDYREIFFASSYAGLSQGALTKQVNAGHIFTAKGYDVQGRQPYPVLIEVSDET